MGNRQSISRGIRLSPETASKIDEIAKENGQNASTLIRLIIEAVVSNYDGLDKASRLGGGDLIETIVSRLQENNDENLLNERIALAAITSFAHWRATAMNMSQEEVDKLLKEAKQRINEIKLTS